MKDKDGGDQARKIIRLIQLSIITLQMSIPLILGVTILRVLHLIRKRFR
jgi:hypothetical protein